MSLYSLVVFLGAFLLFQVQPLIAKVLLPWFGGSAAVWLTCLVFFQTALLAGYAYAHWLTHRVPQRARVGLHLALLAASCWFLPILPSPAWKPTDPSDPALRITFALLATIGLPYLLLAATSPLVQTWYAARHGDEPYRFFAVSNAGSLLGLLSYPALAEPWATLQHQAWIWSGGFLAFALAISALALRRPADGVQGARESSATLAPTPHGAARLLWLALPACASAMLLAVTNHLTQNVAPFPFLWVLPLSLYLLSFVVTFGRQNWYHRGFMMRFMAVALGTMTYALSPMFANAPLYVIGPVYAIGLLVCCVVLHGELARLRPHPSELTSYYLRISLGGAAGGLFVTGIAPLIYDGYYELHVSIAVCAVLALLVLHSDPQSYFYRARSKPAWLALLAMLMMLAGGLYFVGWDGARGARVSARNFYGTLRVTDISLPRVVWLKGETAQEFPQEVSARKLVNGSIDHGTQFRDPVRRYRTTAYYVPRSGVALAIREAGRRGPIRVGVVGLGTGTIAALGIHGDVYRFYEINPEVIEFARREFTYLEDSRAKIEIVEGDARLAMEREAQQNYDVLAVDAFSGDAIPIHLLTIEAFREYFRHLKPGGALVLHVSNQHVDLQPVVQKAAETLQKRATVIASTADDELGKFLAFWAIVSDRDGLFEDTEIKAFGQPLRTNPRLRAWTDEYSNLLQSLKW